MSDARKARLILSLRRGGITDTAVLDALEAIPREQFVPPHFHDQAYEDTALPIGLGQTISQPTVVAGMTEALKVGPRHKVLEIGTGSGYQAAILCRLARRLYTIETLKPLQDAAIRHLDALRLTNFTAKVGDGGLGWPEQAPFDRIIVTCACPEAEPPAALVNQLGETGIMLAPVTLRPGEQWVIRLTRRGEQAPLIENLWPVRFVPLVGSERRAASA